MQKINVLEKRDIEIQNELDLLRAKNLFLK